MFSRSGWFIAAGVVMLASVAHAQTKMIDQGSFAITVKGDRAGREDFTIVSSPASDGEAVLATATITLQNRRVEPKLNADASGFPSSYQVSVSGSGGGERYMGTIQRGRMSVRSQTARGASAKEYIVTQGAVILDDDVFHQYYFVIQNASRGSVPVVVPRRNAQITVRVSSSGTESVSIGGRDVPATKYIVSEPSGAQREVWADAKGKILRVYVPATETVAVREDPPAS
jgi:hypothetical protein